MKHSHGLLLLQIVSGSTAFTNSHTGIAHAAERHFDRGYERKVVFQTFKCLNLNQSDLQS